MRTTSVDNRPSFAGARMPIHDGATNNCREHFCRFLAACYYQPDPVFAEERVFDSMLEAAVGIDAELAVLARRLGVAFGAQGHERLLVDYTRLFLGPTRALARPYGSAWLDGEEIVMGPSTLAVMGIYEAGGFEIADTFRELPDHIAAVLEFLYLIIYRENQADRNGEPVALTADVALRKRFVEEYLYRWIGPFTAAVSVGAQSEFYRVLAGLTDRFIAMEVDRAAA